VFALARGWNMTPVLPELRRLPAGLVLDGAGELRRFLVRKWHTRGDESQPVSTARSETAFPEGLCLSTTQAGPSRSTSRP
jgi:hypothetical protein